MFRRRKKVKLGDNKKVKNATKLEVDGVKFKSKLEAFTYKKLKEAGLNFSYETITYTLIPAFEFNGEKIRPCTYTPDFESIDNKIIIECKGFPNETWPIKWKMFKKQIIDTDRDVYLCLCKNQRDVLNTIEKIKQFYNC